jgi:hypothetical protein
LEPESQLKQERIEFEKVEIDFEGCIVGDVWVLGGFGYALKGVSFTIVYCHGDHMFSMYIIIRVIFLHVYNTMVQRFTALWSIYWFLWLGHLGRHDNDENDPGQWPNGRKRKQPGVHPNKITLVFQVKNYVFFNKHCLSVSMIVKPTKVNCL